MLLSTVMALYGMLTGMYNVFKGSCGGHSLSNCVIEVGVPEIFCFMGLLLARNVYRDWNRFNNTIRADLSAIALSREPAEQGIPFHINQD